MVAMVFNMIFNIKTAIFFACNDLIYNKRKSTKVFCKKIILFKENMKTFDYQKIFVKEHFI